MPRNREDGMSLLLELIACPELEFFICYTVRTGLLGHSGFSFGMRADSWFRFLFLIRLAVRPFHRGVVSLLLEAGWLQLGVSDRQRGNMISPLGQFPACRWGQGCSLTQASKLDRKIPVLSRDRFHKARLLLLQLLAASRSPKRVLIMPESASYFITKNLVNMAQEKLLMGRFRLLVSTRAGDDINYCRRLLIFISWVSGVPSFQLRGSLPIRTPRFSNDFPSLIACSIASLRS
ncbi:hypothetical protein PIB30_019045 [Stylosanthes scabra]|uniref:Uncharacterized protein n=1 Tax=Stylosanthes scabra TaxID=79078 RepID=A0ABU6S8D6_9FABA|nr:hypothetical protein [Stylosanthes scabra]